MVHVFFVILLDLLFVAAFLLALVPFAAYRKPGYAVLKRDFVSYFSTPTGYVFWFLFVLLCSFAAFWPHEFFSSNMATLDQLNFWFPIIMVLFIPAITMGMWAEERRQGTDELLLTMPADDLDIVVGKYLAASAIFTVSLLFSQLANFSVLNYVAMGGVDLGLFFTTYLGYWFMGMAMLAIGMVASFLTRNLTVGFVLGVLLNAPLALAHYADVIIPQGNLAQAIGAWSMAEQFNDFGRGVISTSSVAYFVMLIAVGLYLSMVLIGRRHWMGGKDGQSMLGHYLLRIVALVVITVSATLLFTNYDLVRYDATSERISSLSPDSYELIEDIDFKQPVRVEAFISRDLPDAFIRTKYDLKNMLRELQAVGGGNIQVSINEDVTPFSEAAQSAEDSYDIEPVAVQYVERGAEQSENIHLAAAFTCGLERVVIPFFGLGAPVEYELVHAIVRVAGEGEAEDKSNDDAKDDGDDKPDDDDSLTGDDEEEEEVETNRKVLGVFGSDAQLVGGFTLHSRTSFEEQPIIAELRKQYQIKPLSPGDEVDKDEIDVLLVAQPSSLSPNQLENLLAAIRAGVPTAIFEDPAPWRFNGRTAPYVPGTDDPKPPMGGMMGMRAPPPPPKCDIQKLWDLLGVYQVKAKSSRPVARRENVDPQSRQPLDPLALDYRVGEARLLARPVEGEKELEVKMVWELFTPVVWQRYNPYLQVPQIPDDVVIANEYAPGAEEEFIFNPDDPIVSGMHEVLFMGPGAFERAKHPTKEAEDLKFTPLVRLGTETGLEAREPIPPPGIRLLEKQREAKPRKDDKPEYQWIKVSELMRLDTEAKETTNTRYIMAARITGKLNKDEKEDASEETADDEDESTDEQESSDDESADKEDAPAEAETAPQIDVVLVADIDTLSEIFFLIRRRPPQGVVPYRFQNIPFVLNAVDALAGDERFLSIRKRGNYHATLRLIEQQTLIANQEAEDQEELYEKEQNEQVQKILTDIQRIEQELAAEKREAEAKGELDSQAKADLDEKYLWRLQQNVETRQKTLDRNQRQMRQHQHEIQRDLDLKRNSIQTTYKLWAVLLPPIPPLLIGLAVWFRRMTREGETIADSRKK